MDDDDAPAGAAAPSLAAFSRKGRGLLVLAYMAKSPPITMTEFTHASRQVPAMARALREHLEGLGLITSRVVGTRGPIEIQEIELTPLGKRVAARILEIEADLDAAAAEGRKPARAASRRKA
ncbi:MAG TPA: hypothetical protein VHH36_06220 [Candidatus Thermoplasmatota archaeon]|nr:hypothetical protein [Candidatus Thermoplasmatota archaeon]